MVSKKHMEWAARYSRTVDGDERVINAFVALFTAFNPRFDEARFRAAVEKHVKEGDHK